MNELKVSQNAKIGSKDGASCPNFQGRFCIVRFSFTCVSLYKQNYSFQECSCRQWLWSYANVMVNVIPANPGTATIQRPMPVPMSEASMGAALCFNTVITLDTYQSYSKRIDCQSCSFRKKNQNKQLFKTGDRQNCISILLFILTVTYVTTLLLLYLHMHNCSLFYAYSHAYR